MSQHPHKRRLEISSLLPVARLFRQSLHNRYAEIDSSIRRYRARFCIAFGFSAPSALHSEIKTAGQTEFPQNEIDNTISKKFSLLFCFFFVDTQLVL
jgi:hypothetical protein